MPTKLLSRIAAPAIGTMLAGLVLLAGVAQASGGGSSGGETLNVAVPGHVTCSDTNGAALGDNPTRHRGDKMTCTLAGFASTEKVDAALDGSALTTVTVDAHGGGTFEFTVPDGEDGGSHTLTFTGETSKAVATFKFTVDTSAATTTTTSSGGGSAGGGGGLAFTGANVLMSVGAALLLIAGGFGLTVVNRRRRGHG